MCAIYGVCKIYPNCQVADPEDDEPRQPQSIKFLDIINSYKDVNKARLKRTVNWLSHMNKSSSVTWVFREVLLNPEEEEPVYVDII